MEGSDALQVQKLETVIQVRYLTHLTPPTKPYNQLWAIATLVSDVLIAVTMSAIVRFSIYLESDLNII